MAHLIKIFKARKLKKRWKCYQTLKDIGLRQYESDESARESVDSITSVTWLTVRHKKIGNWNTIENLAWNSLIGFLGGVILTYTFFMFFNLGVNISIHSSTCISALTGIMLSLGLAFSTKIRCYVLLLLPVFFSKQGRQALLAYALFLAFTGPARNTMRNMGILSDSMNCGQQIVKKTFKQIVEMRKIPSKSIKDTLQRIKHSAEKAATDVKLSVVKLKQAIIAVLEVVKTGNAWLKSTVDLCNIRVGTPFQRCMKSFEASIADCKARVGVLDFLCHVVHIKKALCYTLKFHDFICLYTEFVSNKAVEVVTKNLWKFHLHMKELFYVSIELKHSSKNKTKASHSTKHLAKTILQRFSEKVEQLQSIFSVFGFMYSLLFLFLFAKVYYYQYKYLSSDHYDNVYINKYIIDLDIKRAQLGKETVLPLEPRERRKYGKPTVLRLLECERSRIAQSMFLLSLTSFKVVTFVAVDYCLFWVLLTICKAGYNSVKEVEDSKFGIRVQGEGVIADFYRGLGKAFQVPKNPYMHLTPLHCLPVPLQPDTRRYMQIGFLVLLCWILTFTEAYGLRLRSVVMSYYYPERARERAVWLYNDILRCRGSFIRFARRQLQKKFGTIGVMPVEKMTGTQQFLVNCPLLGHTLTGRRKMKCLLCGMITTKRLEPLRRCQTPDCPGRYCKTCYQSLENVCTICQHPIEYFIDTSDISEEADSSEEELCVRQRNKNYKCDSSEDNKNVKTSQEPETREEFQDVEACKAPDLIKLDDLNPEIQQRLSDINIYPYNTASIAIETNLETDQIQPKPSDFSRNPCNITDPEIQQIQQRPSDFSRNSCNRAGPEIQQIQQRSSDFSRNPCNATDPEIQQIQQRPSDFSHNPCNAPDPAIEKNLETEQIQQRPSDFSRNSCNRAGPEIQQIQQRPSDFSRNSCNRAGPEIQQIQQRPSDFSHNPCNAPDPAIEKNLETEQIQQRPSDFTRNACNTADPTIEKNLETEQMQQRRSDLTLYPRNTTNPEVQQMQQRRSDLTLYPRNTTNPEVQQMQQRLSDLVVQFTSKTRLSVYRQLKLKLAEKVQNLKRLKGERSDETANLVPDDSSTGTRKGKIKKELSEYVRKYRSLHENVTKSGTEHGSDDSDDSNIKHRFMSYYFVEMERESAFRMREPRSRVRFSEETSEDRNYTF